MAADQIALRARSTGLLEGKVPRPLPGKNVSASNRSVDHDRDAAYQQTVCLVARCRLCDLAGDHGEAGEKVTGLHAGHSAKTAFARGAVQIEKPGGSQFALERSG